jgi:uncharacterized protein YecE (DUF72 family)
VIFIATAGWSIPRLCAVHFPGSGTHLTRYAKVLRGVEINSSFYRQHASETYAGWRKQTRRYFSFAVKLPQAITHDKRLRGARRPLEEFLGGVVGLGRQLGPLIVQLPPSLPYEKRIARGFFALLRDHHDGPVVCEPRHASWFGAGANELMLRYRIGRAGADPAVVPAAAQPGGWPGIVYYRLHGSPRKYWSIYELERVAQWAHTLKAVPRGVLAWCVFDNTAGGGAACNALQMLKMLGGESARHLSIPLEPPVDGEDGKGIEKKWNA